MKSFFAALILIASTSLSAHAIKIATINSVRVLQEHKDAQKTMKELQVAEQKLKNKILDHRKQIEDARKANKTETELQMMAEQFKMQIEPEASKLETESLNKSKQIKNNIDAAVEKVAKEEKVDFVLLEEAVIYGSVDITDKVLKKLGN